MSRRNLLHVGLCQPYAILGNLWGYLPHRPHACSLPHSSGILRLFQQVWNSGLGPICGTSGVRSLFQFQPANSCLLWSVGMPNGSCHDPITEWGDSCRTPPLGHGHLFLADFLAVFTRSCLGGWCSLEGFPEAWLFLVQCSATSLVGHSHIGLLSQL